MTPGCPLLPHPRSVCPLLCPQSLPNPSHRSPQTLSFSQAAKAFVPLAMTNRQPERSLAPGAREQSCLGRTKVPPGVAVHPSGAGLRSPSFSSSQHPAPVTGKSQTLNFVEAKDKLKPPALICTDGKLSDSHG